jgi:hypothetical protein
VDHEGASNPDPPPGSYFATWGPSDGPVLGEHEPPALGVISSPGEAMPVGVAFPTGHVQHRKGPAVTFRLVVGEVELPGLWLCVGRRFVELGEAPEML